MRWLTVLLAAMVTQAAAAPLIIEHAIVMGQPARPSIVSGVFAVCVRIDIKTEKHERVPVYQLYMRPNQPIPKAGAVCRIEYKIAPMKTCEIGLGALPPEELVHPTNTIRLVNSLTCSAYLQ